MGAKLNLCGQCTRVLFIILNILFLLIGLALIAGGSYLIASGSNLNFLTGNNFVSGAAIIIACGGVTLIITAIGLLGAFGLWRPLLAIYCITVLLIVLLEIAAGIVGFVYRDTITATLSDRALVAIGDYTENGSGAANAVVDFMQESFTCCGWNNASEWLDTTYFNQTQMFPGSCNCTTAGSTDDRCQTIGIFEVYAEPCQEGVQNFFQNNLIAVGAIGLAFGLFEVVGILLSCILLIAVHKSTNSYTSV